MKLAAKTPTTSPLPWHIEEILSAYPAWRTAVIEALSQPRWPVSKEPTTVEVYDQAGLLAGRLYSRAYSAPVTFDRQSLFQAWFYNGRLVVFYLGNEVIVNHLS